MSTRCRRAINAVDASQIERTDSLNIADALQQHVPGIIVSEVTGNPFQPDMQFRGFVASPVAGTPQGLAVYQNGVRINEAFGDTVNWDLIPTTAIRSVTVVTNNPAFGLNALGGAVNVQMKDGFNYRAPRSTRWAARSGASRVRRNGASRSTISPSMARSKGCTTTASAIFRRRTIRRFYGDVGYRNEGSEFHLNMGVANNNFGATATVPVELLQQLLGRDLHHAADHRTTGRLCQSDRKGRGDADLDHRRRGACARVRPEDGGWQSDRRRSPAPPIRRCFASTTTATPANGLNGVQLANPLLPDAVLGEIDRTTTRSTTAGASAAGDQHRPAVRAQQPLRGRRQYRLQRHALHGQRGIRHDRFKLRRQRQRHISRAVRRSDLDRPGRASRHQSI